MTKLFFNILVVGLAVVTAGLLSDSLANTATSGVLCSDLPVNRFQVQDQDELWANGVLRTWQAANMAPGDLFDFAGSFLELRSSETGLIDITCDYKVTEESPRYESDTDPDTDQNPASMANCLELSRCIFLGNGWSVNFITGAVTAPDKGRIDAKLKQLDTSSWKLIDADGDGIITLADLKLHPVTGLPLLEPGDSVDARFEMSVRFVSDAGDDLQGDTLILCMLYTLTAGQEPARALLIVPETLQLKDRGNPVNATIDLPGEDAGSINLDTVRLGYDVDASGAIEGQEWVYLASNQYLDTDNDGLLELKATFDRQEVVALLKQANIASQTKIILTVAGEFSGGCRFLGTDDIKITN